jgi:hypothetical protein
MVTHIMEHKLGVFERRALKKISKDIRFKIQLNVILLVSLRV